MASGRTTTPGEHLGTTIIFLKGVGGRAISEKRHSAQQKPAEKNRARGAIRKS